MDIVERLRKRRIPIRYGDWTDYEDDTQCHEAADEIKRLRGENQKLLKALAGLYEACKWEKISPEIDAARKALKDKE
jgi:hypothetical protein